MQGGKAGGSHGWAESEVNKTKQIQNSVVGQSYQACGFFAESRAVKNHVNPLTSDEQGPDNSRLQLLSLLFVQILMQFHLHIWSA